MVVLNVNDKWVSPLLEQVSLSPAVIPWYLCFPFARISRSPAGNSERIALIRDMDNLAYPDTLTVIGDLFLLYHYYLLAGALSRFARMRYVEY